MSFLSKLSTLSIQLFFLFSFQITIIKALRSSSSVIDFKFIYKNVYLSSVISALINFCGGGNNVPTFGGIPNVTSIKAINFINIAFVSVFISDYNYKIMKD